MFAILGIHASLADAALNFDPHAALTGSSSSTGTGTPPPAAPAPVNGTPSTTPVKKDVTSTSTTSSSNPPTTDGTASNGQQGSSESPNNSLPFIVTGVTCSAVVMIAGAYVWVKKRRNGKTDMESVFTISSKSTSVTSSPQSSLKSPISGPGELTLNTKLSNSSLGKMHPIRKSGQFFQIKNVESYEINQSKPASPVKIQPNTMHSITPIRQDDISTRDTELYSPKRQNSIVSIASSSNSDVEHIRPFKQNVSGIGNRRLDSVCSSRKAFSTVPISPNLV